MNAPLYFIASALFMRAAGEVQNPFFLAFISFILLIFGIVSMTTGG